MAKTKKPYYPRPNAKGRSTWSKGFTKLTHPKLLSISQKMIGKKRPDLVGKTGPKNGTGKAKTEEKEQLRRLRISTALKGRPGVYRQQRGKGLRGVYQGIWCDSSWELAWILFHMHLTGIKFSRNFERFEYEFEGIKRFWIPDFKYSLCETFVEVKGYLNEKDSAKISQFKGKLVVFDKVHMTPILNRVISHFGKDFTRLYDTAIQKKPNSKHYNTGKPRSEETKRKISKTLRSRRSPYIKG